MSSEDLSDNEWDMIERKKRNKEKRKRRKVARNKVEEDTFETTNHILGLGPIRDDDLNRLFKEHKDYKAAKIKAVQEFLQNALRFNDEEIEDIKITEAVVSAKRDGIVYAAFEDKSDIHEVRLRIAECKNDAIIVRNFIPPQVFERYMFVNKLCQVLRNKNERIRTQIRFGVRDVEVMVKEKGSKEPYRLKPLEELTDLRDIPGFDHTKRWVQRVDRPPRRRAFSSNEREVEQDHPDSRKQHVSPPVRQNSIDNNPSKRSRKGDSTRDEATENMEEDTLNISDLPGTSRSNSVVESQQ